MYRSLFPVAVLMLLSVPGRSVAQANASEANLLLDAEQMQYREFLPTFSMEPGLTEQLTHFASVTVDSLQQQFNGATAKSDTERRMILNATRYFLQSLRASLSQGRFSPYDIPVVLKTFPLLAEEIFKGNGVRGIMGSFGARRTQLMADAFRQYPIGKNLQQLADIRTVAVSPKNILPFMERRPDFPYTDTALVYVAERDPMEIVDYLNAKNNRLTDSIQFQQKPLMQQLVQLKGDRNAPELAPFAEEMAAGRLNRDSLLALRRDNVPAYFQLYVNTIQNNRSRQLQGAPLGMQPALRDALHAKALAFFVRPVNQLHESKDAVRFKSLDKLRNIDLYYILVSDEDELYTSSFLGIYKRMMASLPEGRSDSLLQAVQYDQFRKFIRICSHYNVLSDYLNNMPEASRKELLRDFISNIDANIGTGMESAMDVADAFVGLAADSIYGSLVADLLTENIKRCNQKQSYYGVRLYGVLQEVFQMARYPEASNVIFRKLGNYEKLSIDSLCDKEHIVNQLVIFYGDEDGKASYRSFMNLFRDKQLWQINQQDQWTEIQSLTGEQPIRIFANLPNNSDDGSDERAQLALLGYLQQQGVKPGIIIHRGHSYHLPNTLEYLRPYMKLAILGSCGGYRNILTVAGKSPSAQIIATKQVGSMQINDPMIQAVNAQLSRKEDIYWPEFWAKMENEFNRSAFTRELFAEYIPPYRNLSLFVIRLYNDDEVSL